MNNSTMKDTTTSTKTRYWVVLFLLGACASSPSPTSQPVAHPTSTQAVDLDPELASIDTLLSKAVEKGPLAGLSISVARGNEIFFEKGFGFADVDKQVAASASTVYRIGSVTKQFTAVAILQLVEASRVRLDAPLTDILPNYPMHGKIITIRHLLTHTSGVKSYTALEEWKANDNIDKTTDEMVALFKDLPLEFTPGEAFSYSNSGYFLLGVIIEKASGLTYEAYLQDKVFAPAGLKSTTYCNETHLAQRRAQGYQRTKGKIAVADSLSMTQPYSAGAICSTTQDLLRWRRALNENVLLSAKSLALMETSGTLNDGSETGYGFGFFVGHLGEHQRVFHGGSINGFSAQTAYYPSDDLSVAILSNTEGAGVSSLEDKVVREILSVPEPQVLRLVLPKEEMKGYVGQYSHPGFGQLSVTVVDGVLHGQLPSQPAMPLLYQGDAEFVPDLAALGAKIDPTIRIQFTVKTVTITQRGMTIRLVRVSEQ